MIRAIGKFITKAVDGLAKIVAVLLFKLGLWIPALFSIAFFIITLSQGKSFDKVYAIFYIGLGISLACSVSFALALRRMRTAKKERYPAKERQLCGSEEDKAEDNDVLIQPKKQTKTKPKTQQVTFDYTKYDNSDLDRKYFDVKPTEIDVSERKSAAILRAEQRLNNATGEQPLVFATRADENLFIYEYSNRLEYWRKTNDGMVFERSEQKEIPVMERK